MSSQEKTTNATIPFDEIAAGATARLAVIQDVQYISARDVLEHIHSTTNKHASKLWERLTVKQKEELSENQRYHQFPGRREKKQPVLDFKGVLKLVMMTSGKRAALYRSAMVKILTRYYAGDGSLTDEIETNAQSTSPIAQMARASLAAVPEQDELSLVRKRKLEDLEITRLETEVEAGKLANRSTELANRTMELTNIAMARDSAREHLTIIRDSAREHLTKITTSYRELCQDTVIDERARLMLKDNFLNMAMVQADSGGAGQALITNGQASVPQNKPISLSMIATELGIRIPSNDLISIGVELKKRYCQLHGKEPSKHDQLCNGRMTKVNTYMESDRSLVDEVLRWYAANRD